MSKTNYIASMQGMPILADRAKKTESGTNIDSALSQKQDSLGINSSTGDAAKFLNEKGQFVATSVAWSNVSGKPTKLSDFTDDITQHTYIASGTGSDKPTSGAAVAQALGNLSSFTYESIGDTAVDLNDKLYAGECHAYVWAYANRGNVSNKPSNDGGVVLSFAYYSTVYGVQIAMDGNDYEKPLYIRFKAANQWGNWIQFRDASWINSGTFAPERIGGTSGTSGQYLKSNGSGNAPSWDDTSNLSVGSATKLVEIKKSVSANTYTAIAECYNSDSSLDFSYSGLIFSFTCRTQSVEDVKGLIVVSPYEWDTTAIISKTIIQGARSYSNNGTVPEFIIVGNSNKRTVQLWVLAPYNCRVVVSAVNLSGASFSSINSTSPTAPANSVSSDLYCEVVAKTTNNNKSVSKIGDTTLPVYVDADGSVKPCSHITKSYSGSFTIRNGVSHIISLSGYDLQLTLSSGKVLVQLKRSTGSVTAKVSRVWHGQTHTGDNEAVHVLYYESMSVSTSYVTIDGDCPVTTSSYPKDVHGNGIVALSDGGSIEYNIGTHAAGGASSIDVVYIIKQS